MFDLDAIQSALREFGLDGWLLHDFRGGNVLARRVLDLEGRPAGTRRFLYAIPASGAPRKLVHRIEAGALDHLPGERRVYLRWQEWEEGVAALVAGMGRVAMEYSPRGRNPYVARVDAGTVELVRCAGAEVVSSGDLVQRFEATWDDDQWRMHREAEAHTRAAYALAWGLIADRAGDGGYVGEAEVQAAILDHFRACGLTTYSPPIVAVGAHSGDPHYEPEPERRHPDPPGRLRPDRPLGQARPPRAVYSDLTRVGYVGDDGPASVRGHLPDRRPRPRRRDRAGSARPSTPAISCTAGRSMPPRVGSSTRPDMGHGSSIARATASARRPTATARTWTTSRRTTSGSSCHGPASRSSRASTSTTSASGARSTSSSTPRAGSTSPAASRTGSCRSLTVERG